MSLSDLVRAGDAAGLVARIPYFRTLGVEIATTDPTLSTHLPFQEGHIGNQAIRALHGGIVASFLDATALAMLVDQGKLANPPKPINMTVDYLRPARAESLYGEARIAKLGRRIASLRALCWQHDRDVLVAQAMCHYLVSR